MFFPPPRRHDSGKALRHQKTVSPGEVFRGRRCPLFEGHRRPVGEWVPFLNNRRLGDRWRDDPGELPMPQQRNTVEWRASTYSGQMGQQDGKESENPRLSAVLVRPLNLTFKVGALSSL